MVRKGLYLVHRFGLPASSERPDGHERGKGVSSKEENNNNNNKKSLDDDIDGHTPCKEDSEGEEEMDQKY